MEVKDQIVPKSSILRASLLHRRGPLRSNCDAKVDATLIEIYTPEYTFDDISWSHIILGEQNHACKAPPPAVGVCLWRLS